MSNDGYWIDGILKTYFPGWDMVVIALFLIVAIVTVIVHILRVPPVTLETTQEGDGKTFPSQGDTVTVHYTGTLAASGKPFDSSRDPPGQPFTFPIGTGRVVAGWDQGIMQMSLGQRARLKIPSELGYGDQGAGEAIPPNADLVFDVELLKIN